jgi:hypothetical protein
MKHPSSVIRVPREREAPTPEITPVLESPLDLVWKERVGPSTPGALTGFLKAMFYLSLWGLGFWGVGAFINHWLHGRW